MSCENDGKCRCRLNFQGDKCDACVEGFYNFPICEGALLVVSVVCLIDVVFNLVYRLQSAIVIPLVW